MPRRKKTCFGIHSLNKRLEIDCLGEVKENVHYYIYKIYNSNYSKRYGSVFIKCRKDKSAKKYIYEILQSEKLKPHYLRFVVLVMVKFFEYADLLVTRIIKAKFQTLQHLKIMKKELAGQNIETCFDYEN